MIKFQPLLADVFSWISFVYPLPSSLSYYPIAEKSRTVLAVSLYLPRYLPTLLCTRRLILTRYGLKNEHTVSSSVAPSFLLYTQPSPVRATLHSSRF